MANLNLSGSDPPGQPGGYVLALRLRRQKTLPIGRLGLINFATGVYAYVGSARGPGGIRARVRRHARVKQEKRFHWHIDFLLAESEITRVWWLPEGSASECELADALSIGGQRRPRGFGASDCKCDGHLIHFLSLDRLESRIKDRSLRG